MSGMGRVGREVLMECSNDRILEKGGRTVLTPQVALEGICFRYDPKGPLVLRDLSLSVERERIVAILGESGGGKSSLLRIVAGLERSERGTVRIGGRLVASEELFCEPEHRGVGMVFQDYALFPHMTVSGNVGFGLRSTPRADRSARVAEILELVGLAGYERRYPHELSGGQQQRAALARALAPSPDVLLLDEPFSNLDAALKERLRGDVRAILKRSGVTAMFVTHDVEDARTFADEIVNLSDLQRR